MIDLIKKVRSMADDAMGMEPGDRQILTEAADEIERLRNKLQYKDDVIDQRNAECSRQFKEIEKLRAALKNSDNL